jgi:pimeloyl-ACP methyl ester carboxylesterase
MRWALAVGVLVSALVCAEDELAQEDLPPPPVLVRRPITYDYAYEEAHEHVAAEPTPRALHVEGDLEAYVVDAARAGGPVIVFLTGSCTHPLPSLKAFQHAGAEHGGILALQGDLPCKSDETLRRWSPDTVLTSARIDAALAAAGATAATDLTLMGYSQGAERAEWLARRFPAKYTRFVLMAGPVVPAPSRFGGARAVVALAGHGDVRENMAEGARRLRRASIPALYLEVPGTQHGELSPEIDAFVGQALDWLDANALPQGGAPGNASAAKTSASDAPPKHRAH